MSKLESYKKALKTVQEKRNGLIEHVFSHKNDGEIITPKESDFKGFIENIENDMEFVYSDPVSASVHVTVLYDNKSDLELDKKMWKAKIKDFDAKNK